VIFVLDSSAILAIIRAEPGADVALKHARSDGLMSAVNVSEVVTKCIDQNYPEDAALEVIQSCGLRIVPLDETLAILTGRLRRLAPKGVLSVGDRACIATAAMAGGTAVTSDRIWRTLELPCPVEFIR
jgi:ribonuclease VapC